MLIDGRKIAGEICERLKRELTTPLTLLVLQVGEDPASTSFIKMKKSFGERAGINVVVEQFPENIKTHELVARIKTANVDPKVNGIIVQLPLPKSIDTQEVLDAINVVKDPDLLSSEAQAKFRKGESDILPPVVAAVAEIVERHKIDLYFGDVVVVGHGHLVGEPVGKWLELAGVEYALVTSENKDPGKILRNADVIISGVGRPGLIKPNMLKEGCVLIDAGTSESPDSGGQSSGGRSDLRTSLVGDADPACAPVCSLMTPVPGGVGPIAVAKLFENLLLLSDLVAK